MKKIIIALMFLSLITVSGFAQQYNWRYQEISNCSGLTIGKFADLCHQTTDDTLWKCVPNGSGDTTCDSVAEWHKIPAGWTSSTGKVVLTTSTDNVGIGTAIPVSALEVRGTLTSGNFNNVVVVDGTVYAKNDTGIELAMSTLTSGGMVFLPPGTYTLTGAIDVNKDNIRIIGSGINQTTLTIGGTHDFNAFNLANGVDYLTLKDFKINGAAQTGTTYAVSFGTPVTNIEVDNIYFAKSANDCFHSEDINNNYIYIHDSTFDLCGRNSIYLYKPQHVVIDNNKSYNSVSRFLYVYSSGGATFGKYINVQNNFIDGVGTDQSSGIHITENNSVINVLGNSISNTANTTLGVNGIFMLGDQAVVADNTLYNVTGAGIESVGKYVVIADNSIYKNFNSTATSSGISINGGGPMTIVGNTVSDSTGNGIKLDAADASIYNINVTGNIVRNPKGSGVYVNAATNYSISHVKIANNLLYDDQAVSTMDYGIEDGGSAGSLSNIVITDNDIYGGGGIITGFTGTEVGKTFTHGNVGIGTTIPRSLLELGQGAVIYTGSTPTLLMKGDLVVDGGIYGTIFGNKQPRTVNTVYQADTDGILMVNIQQSTAAHSEAYCYTSLVNPPITIVANDFRPTDATGQTSMSVTCAIRKNDYYKASHGNGANFNIWFQPKY